MISYEKVAAARGRGRPTSLDFINSIFADFTELHGDRRFADDRAVVAGLAWLENTCVTVIGLKRARTSRSGRCGISAWPTPRATERRCAR